MSELVGPISSGKRREELLDRLVSMRVRVNWQLAAYAGLLIAAATMRFWDLGSRALHHDESLHAWTAWKLFDGQGYEHVPWMHGPLQFFGTAFSFFLFGVGDYTARIFPALFGSALVAVPFFLRRRLGSAGALILAVALAFSPTLLYFSRFARNDIYIALFTLGLVVALWRYIDEQKPAYLYAGALLLGLAFATKESIFINAAVLIAFLNVWMAVHFWRQIRDHERPDAATSVSTLVLLLPFAWAVAALWPFSDRWRQRIGLTEWHPAADFLIVLGTLTLPQFAAAIQVPLSVLGIGDADLARSGAFGASRENVLGFFTIVSLVAAAALVGLRWNARAWLFAAAAFYVPYALLYTSFFTNLDGFYSGHWGSLDYWLDQQDVARGEQPWFYYLMLLPTYEFLALAFAAPALFYYAVKGDVFRRFLVFWVVATLFGFSYAGEKMPWVSVTTSLPVLVLGAYALGELITSDVPRRGARLLEQYARPLAAAALGVVAFSMGIFGPAESPWIALRALLVLAAVLGIVWLLLPPALEQQVAAVALGRQPSGRRRQTGGPARYAAVGASALAGGLLAVSLFVGVRATYEYGDVPRELLVYTQTSPVVPDVVEGIDTAGARTGLEEEIPIVLVNAPFEPWGWYLRDYTNVSWPQSITSEPADNAIVLVSADKQADMEPYADRYREPVRFPLRWWFPEHNTYKTLPTADVYRGIRLDSAPRFGADFVASLFQGSTWSNWWDYFRDRKPPLDAETPEDTFGRLDMVAYFPTDYDVQLPGAGPAPEPPVSSPTTPPPSLPALEELSVDLTLAGPGSEPGSLNDPGGLTLDPDGNLYVADTFNHRIQKFDPKGNFLAEVGANGTGNGQFTEPWGVAVDGQGNLYVADSFNHRIQKFDPDLNFLLAFGVPASNLEDPEPEAFWGPRDVAVDPEDNIWIADTGTGRVVKYGPDGSFIEAFGGMGSGPGQFREPTAIEIAANGNIFVADSGNQRVQRLGPDGSFVAEYPVPGWLYVDSIAKPYLAPLPDGGFIASDPTQNKLFRFDASGQAVATFDARDAPLSLPRGVAFDDGASAVYVAEAEPDQVRRLTLP